jgi:hypothetical protein
MQLPKPSFRAILASGTGWLWVPFIWISFLLVSGILLLFENASLGTINIAISLVIAVGWRNYVSHYTLISINRRFLVLIGISLLSSLITFQLVYFWSIAGLFSFYSLWLTVFAGILYLSHPRLIWWLLLVVVFEHIILLSSFRIPIEVFLFSPVFIAYLVASALIIFLLPVVVHYQNIKSYLETRKTVNEQLSHAENEDSAQEHDKKKLAQKKIESKLYTQPQVSQTPRATKKEPASTNNQNRNFPINSKIQISKPRLNEPIENAAFLELNYLRSIQETTLFLEEKMQSPAYRNANVIKRSEIRRLYEPFHTSNILDSAKEVHKRLDILAKALLIRYGNLTNGKDRLLSQQTNLAKFWAQTFFLLVQKLLIKSEPGDALQWHLRKGENYFVVTWKLFVPHDTAKDRTDIRELTKIIQKICDGFNSKLDLFVHKDKNSANEDCIELVLMLPVETNTKIDSSDDQGLNTKYSSNPLVSSTRIG